MNTAILILTAVTLITLILLIIIINKNMKIKRRVNVEILAFSDNAVFIAGDSVCSVDFRNTGDIPVLVGGNLLLPPNSVNSSYSIVNAPGEEIVTNMPIVFLKDGATGTNPRCEVIKIRYENVN